MTLSLDEVRNIRFPMARKPNEDGYRASSVDNFMDKLEISYAQLVEELESLRAAKDAQPAAEADAGQTEALKAEIESLRAQLATAQEAHGAASVAGDNAKAEVERLNGEVASLRAQLDEIRASSDVAATGSEQLRNENEALRAQLVEAQQQVLAAQQIAAQHAPAAPFIESGVQHITVSTSAEASTAVVKLVELATQQAETLLADADFDARNRIAEATANAERINTEAQNRAAQLDADSRASAERMLADARGRAERLDGEVHDRRAELFTSLEAERDHLLAKVNQLRGFEEDYRRTFVGFLQSQIEQVSNAQLASDQMPSNEEIFGLGNPQVSTPRLDKLVAETREELAN